MQHLFSLRNFQLSFNFFKKFILVSFLITVFLVFGNPTIPIPNIISAIIIFKILFFGVIFLSYSESTLKKQLIYYKNFGLSKTVLILISFLMDLAITAILMLIIRIF